MALTATMHRLRVLLSDTDRGVYETLDLRLAQHPSETESYLVTRALAYCLLYEPGIEWSRGLGQSDEPALWIKTADGRLSAWIEVGAPSAERLHKASKASPRVMIFCHHDPELVLREARKTPIFRAEQIALHHPEPLLIAELTARLARNMEWELTCSDGQLYFTVGQASFQGAVHTQSLG